MAGRITSPYAIPDVSMRPSGPIASEDVSGLVEGVGNLAQGVRHLAGSAIAIDRKNRDRANVSQYAQADAAYTKGLIDLDNRFLSETDYENFAGRGESESQRILQESAAAIQDEDARQRWVDETEINRVKYSGSVERLGIERLQEKDRVGLMQALGDNAELVADPRVSPALRDMARERMRGSLSLARERGLISQSEAYEWGEKFVRGSDEILAENIAELDIATGNWQRVVDGMGISANTMGGANIVGAATAAAGGPVALDPSVAVLAAEAIGDKALPSDPALAAAYLKDPAMNQKYVTAAIDTLTTRFKGDMTAAVIAIAPGGGLAEAEKWVRSGHDEAVLSPKTLDFYRKSMSGMQVESDLRRIPAKFSDDVGAESLDLGVLDRWEQTQSAFGIQLPIISAYRDPEHNAAVGGATGSEHLNGRAIDIDLTGIPEDERERLIRTASAMGFGGIGIYKDSLHLDAGERRAWGPDHHKESVPEWAVGVVAEHVAGTLSEVPVPVRGIAPEYAKLPFDKRLKLFADAKQEGDRQALNMQAGIASAVSNAPAAYASTGEYTGYLPKAEDFVTAYGPAEGIARFKQFDTEVGIAQTQYGMRTMSNEEIAAAVESSVPTATGDMAAAEADRFEKVSGAATQIMEARDKDPAGYVMQAFPDVEAAWQAVADDPARIGDAMTLTAQAQQNLGMEVRPLPKAVATAAAADFNNPELPQGQRIAALAGLVFATDADAERVAVLDQMIEAGVKPHVRGAVTALERGDEGAASRLFSAALIDVDKLKTLVKDASGGRTTEDINNDLAGRLFGAGEIGDAVYGIGDGASENIARMTDDMELMQRAVQTAIVTDGLTVDQAIARVSKDMFGDVRVVTGRGWGGGAGMKITLPADEPEQPMRDGFNALLPQVREAANTELTREIATIMGTDNSQSGVAIAMQARENDLAKIIGEGYFANFGGDTYVFVDYMGQAVPDPQTGEPLTFTRDDVLGASAGAPTSYSGVGRPNPNAR